jgi:hypothetical protein
MWMMGRWLILQMLLGWIIIPLNFSQPVKILPMGNSITFDDNVADDSNPRPIGDRISYRYHLYELLTQAGIVIDFVGSENAGNNYFHNEELDDLAGFPGIRDDQLATLISTGYNPMQMVYETPIPNINYLLYFPADIILLHIGTNSVQSSPDDVEDILDNIRATDPDVIIFVARIINRKTYSSTTTAFNNNVQTMVQARNDSRIISVDMENGAGINYTTDMQDNLHPNQAGYTKMAVKWFDAIISLNKSPKIKPIPPQSTLAGNSFHEIFLDTCVTDIEDLPPMISWKFKDLTCPDLLVELMPNHILRVTPKVGTWSGSEKIKLFAEDSGNGLFKRVDSTEVNFTVFPSTSVSESQPIISKVFPNPAQNFTAFTFSKMVDHATLNLYSLTGQMLKSIELQHVTEYTLVLGDFSHQIILYQLISDRLQERGKLIINHY